MGLYVMGVSVGFILSDSLCEYLGIHQDIRDVQIQLKKFQNKTNKEEFELTELYCVMGCNDALNRYFKWLKQEVGTPAAPALVADTLSAYSLSLQWSVPQKFYELARGKTIHSYPIFKNYLVQWRYEFMVNWQFSLFQNIGDNSTIRLENLKPYTKYRVSFFSFR